MKHLDKGLWWDRSGNQTQEHTWQQHGPRSSSLLDSLSLMLLSADHSQNLLEILPGSVDYVTLDNAFGILLCYGTVMG